MASIGLTEEQCKEKKLDYQVGRFPFSANGRARASNETEGFVKIIRDKKYGEILGAHIVGGHASEMIHELAVARENEYTVEEVDLADPRPPHPVGGDRRGGARLDGAGDPHLKRRGCTAIAERPDLDSLAPAEARPSAGASLGSALGTALVAAVLLGVRALVAQGPPPTSPTRASPPPSC